MTAQVLGVLASLLTFVFVFWLLRRGSLQEKYAVLWLAVSGVALLLSIFPAILRSITTFLRVETPSNLLFFVTIVLLLFVAIQLSYELSRHEARIRRLAEEVALLEEEVRVLRDDRDSR